MERDFTKAELHEFFKCVLAVGQTLFVDRELSSIAVKGAMGTAAYAALLSAKLDKMEDWEVLHVDVDNIPDYNSLGERL